MNKKGIVFKSALFSIVAISILVIAFQVIVVQQEEIYGSDALANIDSYDRLNDISTIANSSASSISPNDPDPGDDAEAATFRGVYGIISNIFRPLDILIGNDGMLAEVTNQFGIPDYVRQGIVTFLLIAITFGIVAIIFKLPSGTA